MENLVKYFGNIESNFRSMKILTLSVIGASMMVAIAAIYIAVDFASASRDNIFVVDKSGAALMATSAPDESQKELEAQDHLTRFHELFFSLSPSSESIKRNVDRALVMSDRSAYDYWKDMSERGFYQRLVSANISQQIVVDSVKVNISSYPYDAVTYGRLFLIRESNITAYQFESTCRLVDVERSQSNPHGLMIEKFIVRRNENIGTKRRK